jgi:hypothetical protein
MTVNIAHLLGINKLEYLNHKADQFNTWCTNIAEEIYLPKRILQENAALYQWYSATWDKQITYFFLPDVQQYIAANVKGGFAYQPLFNSEVVAPITKIYPSVIIDKLKKEHYAKITHLSKNKSVERINEK